MHPSGGAHEADVLETEILEFLDLRLTDGVLADLWQVITERVQSRPEHASIQAEIAKVQRQLERLGSYTSWAISAVTDPCRHEQRRRPK